jgi:hypothetical protein
VRTKEEVLSGFPSCYACDNPQTSMEHAPPKCFFPEEKDIKGNYLYRKQLIKVPSCDEHNTRKSNDDVYAVWHLAPLDGVNKFGHMIMKTVLQRMADHDWEKRGGAFARRILAEFSELDHGRPVGKVDAPRMLEFLRLCARAVYFYETYNKLLGPLRVTNIGNDFRDSAKTAMIRSREHFFDSEMGNAEIRGANPGVFNYSICEKSNERIILVRLVFYGTLKHWVYRHPDAREN